MNILLTSSLLSQISSTMSRKTVNKEEIPPKMSKMGYPRNPVVCQNFVYHSMSEFSTLFIEELQTSQR